MSISPGPMAPGIGFLFGWSQLAVVRPGDIALMAFIFARYAQQLFPLGGISQLFFAAAAVVVLTVINIMGVKTGKWTQNILTLAKVLGMAAIIIVGFSAPAPLPSPETSGPLTLGGLDLALILVMFTFGGWNEMAYVAAEIKRSPTQYRPGSGGRHHCRYRALSSHEWCFSVCPGARPYGRLGSRGR